MGVRINPGRVSARSVLLGVLCIVGLASVASAGVGMSSRGDGASSVSPMAVTAGSGAVAFAAFGAVGSIRSRRRTGTGLADVAAWAVGRLVLGRAEGFGPDARLDREP
jgi:hypothetical protein